MTQTTTRSLAQMQDLLRQHETEPAGVFFPVHPRLARAFPRGLRAGAVHTVTGSVSVAVALLAAASQQGSWCAAVGLPDLSIEAAARWGVDLDQLVLSPGPAPWDAVGTLVDAADLILADPAQLSAPLAPAQARRLEARLRARQATLVVLGDWPQPATTIRASTIGWSGLGQGSGCLTEHHLELQITERHRRRTVRLTIPESP